MQRQPPCAADGEQLLIPLQEAEFPIRFVPCNRRRLDRQRIMNIQQLMISNLFALLSPAPLCTHNRYTEGYTAGIQQTAAFFQKRMDLIPGFLGKIRPVQG
ncbi:hypothetical protein D3C73_1143290 [compost metagenome]